ncbi:hypothetical protein NDI39_03420 [Microcoleus sp. ZQ-A2]
MNMSGYDNTVWEDYEGWQNYFSRFDRQDNEWEPRRENERESSYFQWRPVDPNSPEWAHLMIGEEREIESSGDEKNASEQINIPTFHTITSSSLQPKEPFQQPLSCTLSTSVDPHQQPNEVMELITQMENAWDWNEIEAAISKYTTDVRQIAWTRLSERQKAMFKALLSDRYRQAKS